MRYDCYTFVILIVILFFLILLWAKTEGRNHALEKELEKYKDDEFLNAKLSYGKTKITVK